MKLPAVGFVICAAVLGFAAGAYWASPGGAALPSPKPASPDTSAQINDTGLDAAEAEPNAPPGDTRARLYQILTVNDPVERMTLFTAFLQRVNADNWQEAVSAFFAHQKEESREFPMERRFLLEHAGKCAGAAGIESRLDSDDAYHADDALAMLAGWSTADPAAAVAWFEKQSGTEEDSRQRLLLALIKGLSRTDPLRAVRLVENMDAAPGGSADALIQDTFESGGFRAAEDALGTILASEKLQKRIGDGAAFRLALRRANIGLSEKDPEAMLAWADQYVPVVGEATYPIVEAVAHKDARRALDWVEANSHHFPPETMDRFLNLIGTSWKQTAPHEFTEWARANGEDARYDSLVVGAIEACLRGDQFQEARSLAATIRDPAKREKQEATFRQVGF